MIRRTAAVVTKPSRKVHSQVTRSGFTRRMPNATSRPDPSQWAFKLHEAAVELRLNAGRTTSTVKLARRLERYAEAILFPQLPRWWPDQQSDRSAEAAAGRDD